METTYKPNKNRMLFCTRCSIKFTCKQGDISACDCSKIQLNADEQLYVSSRYKDCLCVNCLKELKGECNLKHNSAGYNTLKEKIFIMITFSFLLTFFTAYSQPYNPGVGQIGTNAIYKDSSVFVNWAVGCTVNRGYQDISNASLGFASAGDVSMPTGKAQSNPVLSLGDGGSAICIFEKPISNGTGYDFAVFENSFDDTFLELAFVEVSSDGLNFFRFKAHSLTDTLIQTGSFGSTNATKINNLAGKFRGGYGTPFDLQELSGIAGLNIDNITHVKIIDVVGSIDKNYASRDFYNNKINDPWPTAFPSGGFDLDAIGVIHQKSIVGFSENNSLKRLQIYPNPVKQGDDIHVKYNETIEFIELIDAAGILMRRTNVLPLTSEGLPAGIYFVRIKTKFGIRVEKLLVL